MAYNILVLEHFSLKVRNGIEEDLRKIEKQHNLYFPHSTVKVKVKQSRYRPGVAQRVTGS
jgi:hypothetical protein